MRLVIYSPSAFFVYMKLFLGFSFFGKIQKHLKNHIFMWKKTKGLGLGNTKKKYHCLSQNPNPST
jgi:hypothetical protein